MLLRQRYLIIALTAAGLLAGVALSLRHPKYMAEGVIRIQPGAASRYSSAPLSDLSEGADKIAAEVSILQSRTLLAKVANELNLVADPAFWGDAKKHLTMADPVTRDKVLELLSKSIRVTRDPKEEIVTINCTTGSAVLSAKIINTLVNDYIESLFKMRYGASQRASSWLIGQLDDLKQQIETDQTTLTSLQGRLGLVGIDDKTQSNLTAEDLTALTRAYDSAVVQRILSEAKYRFLQDSDPNLIEGEMPLLSQSTANQQGGLLQTLRATQAEAASKYAELTAHFGQNYPDVREAKAQLAEINAQVKAEQDRILNQAKLDFSAANANEQMTSSALKQSEKQAFSSQGDMVKYAILLRDYEGHRNLYQGLVQRLREATITSGLESAEVDVVDLAEPPTVPAGKKPWILIVIGLFAGLIAGLSFALAIELLKDGISNVKDIEALTGLSLIGYLPRLRSTKANAKSTNTRPGQVSIEVLERPHSIWAEALQGLWESVQHSKAGGNPQVILITSTVPGEGKSTVSLNLAAICALRGKRTLLIDCDLRRGTQATRLGMSTSSGLTNVISSAAPLSTAIKAVAGTDSLFVLPNGPKPPQPVVLISSQEMQDMMLECRRQFDVIILDTPPLLGVADTLMLLQLADAGLLVLRPGLTKRKGVEQALNLWRRRDKDPVGFILNGESGGMAEYGYGYGSYGYFDGESA